MSFSITIFEADIESTLSAAIDDKIAQIPDGAGKTEAQRAADAISASLLALVPEGRDFASAYISGSDSGSNAQLNISVSFKNAERKAAEQAEAAKREQADTEIRKQQAQQAKAEAQKAQAATKKA